MSGNEKVIKLYLEEAYRKAGSNDFNTANNFSENITGVDNYLFESLTGEQASELIINIYKAAEYGAWRAESLKSSEFSSIPKIKGIAIGYMRSNKVDVRSKFEQVDGNGEYFDNLIKSESLNAIS